VIHKRNLKVQIRIKLQTEHLNLNFAWLAGWLGVRSSDQSIEDLLAREVVVAKAAELQIPIPPVSDLATRRGR
jgi:hypothetical protein